MLVFCTCSFYANQPVTWHSDQIITKIQSMLFKIIYEPPHDKNKMSVRPAKTQISLGIRLVWSESSLCAQLVDKDTTFLHADSKDSDQTGRCPGLSDSLLCVHSFCWFCHVTAHLLTLHFSSPESIKNRNDTFYLVPERSCVPDSPVWYSTMTLGVDHMAKMLNRIRLVREIQEAHLHTQPVFI